MSHWTLEAMPAQRGRVHVITGANSGLGRVCTRVLVARGAHVVMACRDVARAEAEAAALRLAHPGAAVEVEPLDLADRASVRACAARVLAHHPRVDALMLNAGLMGAAGARTADGFNHTFAVNHLGHFALAADLLPALAAARVVSVASLYHRIGRFGLGDDPAHPARPDRRRDYADSKLANLLFVLELDRRAKVAGRALVAVAAHPGYSATDFQRRATRAGSSPSRATMEWLTVRLFAQSAERGALPQLRAATDPTLRGGEYLGPEGPGELRGAGVAPARKSVNATDAAAARALWELSERLTGVRFEGV